MEYRGNIKTPETTLEQYEARLTQENRALVERYVRNCNEEWSASILLNPMKDNKGKPLSNSFYLHELKEIERFRDKGFDFVNVENPDEIFRKMRDEAYDSDTEPHLTATLYDCEYLRLKAVEMGFDISLGTIIEYAPFNSKKDKEAIVFMYPDLVPQNQEKDKAFSFFSILVKGERSIFTQPFKLGSSSMYMDVVYERNTKKE